MENLQEKDCRIYEYTAAANPSLVSLQLILLSLMFLTLALQTDIPVLGYDAELHSTGPTRLIPFDLSKELVISSPATTPNLLAHFIRICPGESITSNAKATSQAFYVIRLVLLEPFTDLISLQEEVGNQLLKNRKFHGLKVISLLFPTSEHLSSISPTLTAPSIGSQVLSFDCSISFS
jgi:hypothetical protein